MRLIGLFFLLMTTALLTADTIRIMPLGDSITYDNSMSDSKNPRPVGERQGYRAYLYHMLTNAGYDFDFVGSEVAGQSVEPTFDPDNEGHPGWNSFYLADEVFEYLEKNPADVILLHIGSNDGLREAYGVEHLLDWIDYYEAQKGQKITVIVALIINQQEYNSGVAAFNNDLRSRVERRIANGDSLVLVDMGNLLNSGDYADIKHPNSDGYYKMATAWFNAIANLGNILEDDLELRAYTTSLVESSYLNRVYVDVSNNDVTFTTEVPDEGIIF